MLCLMQLVCAALGAGLCRVTVIEDSSELLGLDLKVIPVEGRNRESRTVTLALRINSSYVCFDVLASSAVQNKLM